MADKLLWFDSATWLIWLAPFLGVIAAGLSKRKRPYIEDGKVLRHDMPARITHWTHGIGTMMLLISGVLMGLFFMPALVSSGPRIWAMMNIHFVFAAIFLFGTFYYGANTVLATHRLKEHLPTRNAIDYTVRHYGKLLGVKKFTFPPEKKYFESEKMAYILAAVATITIIVTGFIKVAAHSFDIAPSVMGVVTPLHDIATVLMLAFFLAHVFFAAILPMSWPVFRSMLHGWISLEHVEKEHAGWLEEIEAAAAEAAAMKGEIDG